MGADFLRSRPVSILLKEFIRFVDNAEMGGPGFIYRNEVTRGAYYSALRTNAFIIFGKKTHVLNPHPFLDENGSEHSLSPTRRPNSLISRACT
jgi:hypothetical protein